MLQSKEHTEISDIDIRINNIEKLKFRKLPWTEWMFGVGFGVAAAVLFYLIYEEYIEGF